jgi:hypothetical protein
MTEIEKLKERAKALEALLQRERQEASRLKEVNKRLDDRARDRKKRIDAMAVNQMSAAEVAKRVLNHLFYKIGNDLPAISEESKKWLVEHRATLYDSALATLDKWSAPTFIYRGRKREEHAMPRHGGRN